MSAKLRTKPIIYFYFISNENHEISVKGIDESVIVITFEGFRALRGSDPKLYISLYLSIDT